MTPCSECRTVFACSRNGALCKEAKDFARDEGSYAVARVYKPKHKALSVDVDDFDLLWRMRRSKG